MRLRHAKHFPIMATACMLDKLTSDSFHIPLQFFFFVTLKSQLLTTATCAFNMKIMVKTLA